MRRLVRTKRFLSALISISLLAFPGVGAWNENQSNVFFHMDNDDKRIALTFDDGPNPTYTEEILDILDQYGIKATFFVIGQNVGYYPELVAEEVDRGHEIGNHTYHHIRCTNVKTQDELIDELQLTEDAIYEAAEYHPKLFRPPEGRYDDKTAKTAEALDYNVIIWTVDTCDWRRPSVQSIVDNVLTNTSSGSIILCHDGIRSGSPTPAALRIFIPELQKRGYQFVTVSELILDS